jgi:hypothetical protein
MLFLCSSQGVVAGQPGVVVSLQLESHAVWIDIMPGLAGPLEPIPGIRAAFRLANRSGEALALDLISHCGEQMDIQFELEDEQGNLIWERIGTSPVLGCPDILVEVLLAPGDSLGERVVVPLRIDGLLVPEGRYLLRARLDGLPRFEAAAEFSVSYAY